MNIRINNEELKQYIKNNPDKTQKEIGERFNIPRRYLRQLIKKHNIPYIVKTRSKSKSSK